MSKYGRNSTIFAFSNLFSFFFHLFPFPSFFFPTFKILVGWQFPLKIWDFKKFVCLLQALISLERHEEALKDLDKGKPIKFEFTPPPSPTEQRNNVHISISCSDKTFQKFTFNIGHVSYIGKETKFFGIFINANICYGRYYCEVDIYVLRYHIFALEGGISTLFLLSKTIYCSAPYSCVRSTTRHPSQSRQRQSPAISTFQRGVVL